MDHLGDYLFKENTNQTDDIGIDTFIELDDRLMDSSINHEIIHYENELYLELIPQNEDGSFTLSEETETAFTDEFVSDYNSGSFTTFADYTDETHTGLDSNSTGTYGDVNHTDGLALINEIWDATDHDSMHDFLTSLYYSENVSLKNIFTAMDTNVSGNLYGIETIDKNAFDPTALGLLDENGDHTLDLATYFDDKADTDAYVDLYLTHLMSSTKYT